MPTAIFTIEGMTATHFASLITLSGIALSGVAMISFKTLVDASRRLAISDSSLSSADHAMPTQSSTLAPSTRRHLGNTDPILVISGPLPFPCSKEQLFGFSCEVHTSLRVLPVPSGPSCKVNQHVPEK